ncbi:PREDICTED: putative F-box protein At1g70960 [Camelina sativa]|uniref:F-box protein At1g70960 n=1 Tax=Camelina sativa TaxID=90675 RepID=A0ABM0TU56_CAMSA|nr:PREDICTED: putative F-box protein At1g70960 [Camelina sativa]
MENTSGFEALPVEIQTEILSQLPLKFLMIFSVSKKWSSLIRTKEFRQLYLSQSMKRPRVMFMVHRLKFSPTVADVLFHSVSQEEESLLMSSGSDQQEMCISPEPGYDRIAQPVRGLICLRKKSKVVIYNPGTGKTLTYLPKIEARKQAAITTFFGYDEVTNVFKVLAFDKSQGAKVHQILTIGSSKQSWRRIICDHDHSPVTEGLYKDGVLYYGARSHTDKSLLMSFNLSSEVFTVIELPEGVDTLVEKLVIFKGEIALVKDPPANGSIQMMVRNEVSGEWGMVSFMIPQWKQTVEDMVFYFIGTVGTRKLVFVPAYARKGSLFVLYFDTATRDVMKYEIKGVVGNQFHSIRTFLDHIDSPLLL